LDQSLVSKKILGRAKNSIPSLSAFYAYIGTDLDLPSLGINSATIQHNDSAATMESPVTDLTFQHFLLSSTTLKDPERGHAPPGQHNIEIVAQAPFEPFKRWAAFPSRKRGQEYKQFKQELGWNLIRKAERYVPGLSSHIKYVNFATPVTNLYWVNAPDGGCYGPAHLPSQVGPKRFSIKSNIPGIYLCGHGTMAGGVYPSMRSGEIAASHIVNFLGKNTECSGSKVMI